ncbi:MAG: transporter substrate-binding domain-containing protein [Lachnospiraceae bacterium]|nr:transporter substrate-binding domain-containing protein [Lachnospiraceae bacterium]
MIRVKYKKYKFIGRAAAIFLCVAFFFNGVTAFFPQTKANATEAGRKKVRVGYYISKNMQEDSEGHKNKSGLGYEYLQKISYYSNWEYEYVYGGWEELFAKFMNGQVDVMAGISKTPEREKKILFPSFIMGSENYYVYAYEDNPIVTLGSEGLKNCKIGANKNTLMEACLREWNEKKKRGVQIQTYSGNDALYQDLNNGTIDAIVDTDNAVEAEDRLIPIVRLGASEYYLAVTKQRPDILEELNTAQDKIMSTDPNFTKKLTEKYFSNTAIGAKLQKDEEEWLKKNKQIRVGYLVDYMPFSDRSKDGKEVMGIVKDVMEEILKELGQMNNVSLRYVGYHKTEELIRALKTDAIDVAFPIDDDVGMADKNGIFLSESLITTSMDLVFKGKYSEDTTKVIAVKKGNEIQEEYTKVHYPKAKIRYYQNFEQALDAVRYGEANSIVINNLRTDGFLSHARYKGLKSINLVDTSSRCMAVKAGNNKLLSIVNRGITNLPTNFAMVATYPYIGSLGKMQLEDFVEENWLAIFVSITIAIVFISALAAFLVNSRRKRKMLDSIAHHDSMTGLFNRRAFDEQMDQEGNHVSNQNLLLLEMDLNGLKRANDTLGHAAGDEMIQGAATCMKEILGPYGKVYRTGGDEFVAILRGKNLDWSKVIRELSDTFCSWSGYYSKNLSVAIGSCSSDEKPTATMNEMMAEADRRLYQDKENYYRRTGLERRKY